MQPGIITFRPDNFLTVGLIGAIVYVGAVLVCQLLGRAGVISLGAGTPVVSGTAAQS